ncbi:MAG: STAS domain-containing protein [Phycisphaerales bacterium]|jgi:anti-anti-sigma factor|nr:STAS domain-containing protein [Phycisphaerales bacterium]
MGTTGESLFVKFQDDADALVASIHAPTISQRESEIISTALAGAMADASGYKWLVIDMREVTFMSSMGIGMLVDARSRAAGQEMKVVLANVATEMDQLLRMVKLEKVFAICTNDKQLKKALKR